MRVRPIYRLASLLLCVGAFFVASPAMAKACETLATGSSQIVFSGWSGPKLPVFVHKPQTAGANSRILFVMHGVNRDADRYRDEWAGLAVKHRFIVIVPEFSRSDFPGAASYNTGFFAEEDGTLRPRTRWSFAAIEPLFDETRRRFGTAAERYSLYGHSAGAQFVHRFVMFMPEARIEQAIAANAGWYTMPDPALAFPYGVEGAPVAPDTLKAVLAKPLTVLLGTADTDRADPNLRKTPEADAQVPLPSVNPETPTDRPLHGEESSTK